MWREWDEAAAEKFALETDSEPEQDQGEGGTDEKDDDEGSDHGSDEPGSPHSDLDEGKAPPTRVSVACLN